MKVRVGSIEMRRRMYNGVMKGTYVGRGHPYLLQQLLQLHLKICTARVRSGRRALPLRLLGVKRPHPDPGSR